MAPAPMRGGDCGRFINPELEDPHTVGGDQSDYRAWFNEVAEWVADEMQSACPQARRQIAPIVRDMRHVRL